MKPHWFVAALLAAQCIASTSGTRGIAMAASPAQAAATKDAAPPAIERKLLGFWKGPACGGDYTFHADGTFELKHFTPANNALTGRWSIRWDALPPTLALAYKTSDFTTKDPAREEYAYFATGLDVKLIELDDETLVYRMPGDQGERHFHREAKK